MKIMQIIGQRRENIHLSINLNSITANLMEKLTKKLNDTLILRLLHQTDIERLSFFFDEVDDTK